MYRLLTDFQITRRQRMCFVLDAAGDLAWSGKSITAAIQYLCENDQTRFQLEGPPGEARFTVKIETE